jgi:hypothetical protein
MKMTPRRRLWVERTVLVVAVKSKPGPFGFKAEELENVARP